MKRHSFRLGIDKEQTGLIKDYSKSYNVGCWVSKIDGRIKEEIENREQTGPVRIIRKDGKPFYPLYPSALTMTGPKENKGKDSQRGSDKS